MSMNSVRGFVMAGLMASLGGSVAFGQNYVKPGDTVEIPLPVINANDNGEPGGDTISAMKVVVTGDSAFVTNPTDSATQSLAPGEVKTFTPSFVVGPNVVGGQIYTVTLQQVSADVGIDPDLSDPSSFVQVGFNPGSPLCSVGSSRLPIFQTPLFTGRKLRDLLRPATAAAGRIARGTEARARRPASLRVRLSEYRPAPDAGRPFGPDTRAQLTASRPMRPSHDRLALHAGRLDGPRSFLSAFFVDARAQRTGSPRNFPAHFRPALDAGPSHVAVCPSFAAPPKEVLHSPHDNDRAGEAGARGILEVVHAVHAVHTIHSAAMMNRGASLYV